MAKNMIEALVNELNELEYGPKGETASQAYNRSLKDIESELSKVSEKLTRHKSLQSGNPENWGYVGDLSFILSRLKEITEL